MVSTGCSKQLKLAAGKKPSRLYVSLSSEDMQAGHIRSARDDGGDIPHGFDASLESNYRAFPQVSSSADYKDESVNSESPPIFCSSPSRYIEVRRGRSLSDANDTKDTDGHTAKRRRSTSSNQRSSYPPPCNECDNTRRAGSRSPLIKQTPTKPSSSVKCTLDSFDDQRFDVAPGWPRSTHTTDQNGRSLSREIDPLVSIAASGAMERALLENDREAPMPNECQQCVSPDVPSIFAPAIWIWISLKRRNEELQSGGCKDATNISTREAFFEMIHRGLRRFMKNDERIAVAEVHQVKIDADLDLHIPGYPILNSCDDVGWEFLRFMSAHKEVARIMLVVIVTVECSEVNENDRDI